MSSTKEIHVGTPADDFDFKSGESVTIHSHDFLSVPGQENIAGTERFSSGEFTCAGYTWIFDVMRFKNKMAAILCTQSSSRVNCGVCISLIHADRAGVETSGNHVIIFDQLSRSKMHYAKFSFQDRRLIFNKGTLSFVVSIRPTEKYYRQPETLSLSGNILKLFGDEETSDLAFQVGDTTFYAQKFILKAQEPELFQLSEHFDKDAPMPINDVKPAIFEIMLKYIYGKIIHVREWKEHAKQIMEASNKYGFTRLTLEAEAFYVKEMNLTVENAIDELLYADGSDFTDIKKAVVKFIVENGQAIIASPSFSKLYASAKLTQEVMMEIAKTAESRKRKVSEQSS